MPVLDLAEARDVDEAIERIVRAPNVASAFQEARALFAEKLDFSAETGAVSLNGTGLPAEAYRLAQRSGLRVLGVELPSEGRVRAPDLQSVLKELRRTLTGDILLLATEKTHLQWHFIFPSQREGREIIRRMVVHTGQPRRTVCQQLAGIYRDTSSGTDLLTALDRAYDVESVTKKFFEQYREAFQRVMTLVEPSLPDEEERKLFCQTLFNRLMFIYFLQRKGWLTFNGETNYLDALWQAALQRPEDNFYNTRLKILFFSALNNPRDSNWDKFRHSVEGLIGTVPFLNGGLFSDGELDKRADIEVPNEAIRLILRGLFARFNFTISESTPYDIEVAVDPEMLGKVFEELVTGRHETGSYYTPRPIVSFMCREALKQHLIAHVQGLTPELASAFVDDHHVAGLNMQQAGATIDALESTTVLDPACGSGAYLLGMLHELIELQRLIYSSSLVHDAKSMYDLKLRVIANNLYGVDKDPFATNIAMLRLWLSLAIDFDDPGDPLPLPNLDFKIVCADSLIGPPPNPGAQDDLFFKRAREDAAEVAELKAQFLRSNGDRKRVLGAEIKGKQEALKKLLGAAAPLGSVNWLVDFAEVFEMDRGFSVVLANPPYVRADAQFRHIADEAIRAEALTQYQGYRRRLRLAGHYRTLYDKWDLYIPFLERAFQLLGDQGTMVFIISDSFNVAKYAGPSQDYFVNDAHVRRIDFCSEIDIFDAGIKNTILHVVKLEPSVESTTSRVQHFGRKPDDFETGQSELEDGVQKTWGRDIFRPDGGYRAKMSAGCVTLAEICYLSWGLRPNSDERQHRGAFTTKDVISNEWDIRHPRPVVQGKDVGKWWPNSVRYLEWGTERAPGWFARPTFLELYSVPEKLLAMKVSGEETRVVYDDSQLLCTDAFCVCVPWASLASVKNASIRKTAKYKSEGALDGGSTKSREHLEEVSRRFSAKYLAGVMNSQFAVDWLAKRRRHKIQLYPEDWKALPIPDASASQQLAIGSLVEEIVNILRAGPHLLSDAEKGHVLALEERINNKVAALYSNLNAVA